MVIYSFSNWSEALEKQEDLSLFQRRIFKSSIIEYLSFLKQNRQPAMLENAREYMEQAISQRKANKRTAQLWKDGLNWFFQNAPARKHVPDFRGRQKLGYQKFSEEDLEAERLDLDQAEANKLALAQLESLPREAFQQKQAKAHPCPYPDKRQAHALTHGQAAILASAERELARLIKLMRVRGMSYHTEKAYLGWVRRLDEFHSGKLLGELKTEELKAFLDHLAVHEFVSRSTQRQALNACVFYLREVCKKQMGDFSDYVHANKNRYIPVVYSQKELNELFAQLKGRSLLMAHLQYGTGLRISELIRLRVQDVDLQRRLITLRRGKGEKDRTVTLPIVLVKRIKAHLATVKKLYLQDRENRVSGVYIPHQLQKKYPQASTSWGWYWFWPSHKLSTDPRERENWGVRLPDKEWDKSGEKPARRHHMLSQVYQKQLTEAARKADMTKRSNSHILRHSYATHLIEKGVNICTVQQLLGHKSVVTTEIYLHVAVKKEQQDYTPLNDLLEAG